jgi:hypothetical protein
MVSRKMKKNKRGPMAIDQAVGKSKIEAGCKCLLFSGRKYARK